jgi:YD repeat-containing protein
VITYDGYARPKTKHIPEQAAGLVTTWDYNPDDTVLRTTDARGASSTFGYNNNRRLVTSITYAAPGGISGTPTVTYAYDAAGNRTSMADGLGNVSYQFNSLSQMMSETRSFSDPNNAAINGVTKTLSYDYNLAGQLKKITDPTNSTINYTYDKSGRLITMGGADNLYAGVTQYASAFQYRAWGALKHLTYGNGMNLNFEHNGRLQISRFEAVNSAGQMLIGKEYQYTSNMPNNLTNDGHVKYSKDLVMNELDRTYRYDQVGRLFEGVTGAEARQMKDSGVEDWGR